VVVTSVLQTTAGKMIFGRFVDPSVAAQAPPEEGGARRGSVRSSGTHAPAREAPREPSAASATGAAVVRDATDRAQG